MKKLIAAITIALAVACGPALHAAADVTYGGQVGACVKDNDSKVAIDDCRAKVDAAWGVRVDGGAQ